MGRSGAQHDTYDDYWKARNLAPHLKNIHCAVLTVGGWFDAEDLQGPFSAFHAIEQNSIPARRILSWSSGRGFTAVGRGWTGTSWGTSISTPTRQIITARTWCSRSLSSTSRTRRDAKLAKATVFETGTNVWRHYPSWPPPGVQEKTLITSSPGGGLGW